jgi:TonB family protein
MKYCPTCNTKFDEEILRFCTKDGAPLIDEAQPHFTELPSESLEDDGQETVIRRNAPAPVPQPDSESEDFSAESGQRIVIPTSETDGQQVRTRTTPSLRDKPLPKESNTLVVVLLTIIGTIVVISAAFGVFWMLGSQNGSGNLNVNTNINALNDNGNINANLDDSLLNLNTNFNYNSNTNVNSSSNTNINASTKTPTPSPTSTPTATPTTSPSPTPNDDNTNGSTGTPTPRPSLSPRPTVTPKPSATPSAPPPASPTATPVNMGILNERAVTLKTPNYSQIAREMRASGKVQVQVLVDERGNVSSAKAVSGNPLLRSSAEAAAKSSKFNPAQLNGRNVKTTGYVVYNFVKQN